jgi:hypothetical protein
MTMFCSNSRFCLIPSLWLALWLCAPLHAAELPLRAFTATYKVKASGMTLGTAELSLEPYEQQWRWRLTTKVNAFISVFVSDQPYSETVFTQNRDRLLLQSIVIGDEKDKDDIETAKFDWQSGIMKVLRKGKHKNRTLTTDVYDLQSIHLLAAAMQLSNQQDSRVQFYRKGKLIEARLVYLGEGNVNIDDKEIAAHIYEHSISGSKESLKYYYDLQHPLLPLLIQSNESGKSKSSMKLLKVEWRS